MNHPHKDRIVAVFLSVAAEAAQATTGEHPEDIAYAMTFAIEAAGVALSEANRQGLIA